MRPLELRLRNFRSFFGDEVSINLRDRRLIGVVGPIGSGKSSLLDAVAYALYGRTPTIARSTRSLIHQRAADGAVALRFEVDGDVWEAVRSLRRSGASQHALYRLQDDTEDPEIVEKIVQEGDVNERVIALLGLEFDAFSRSVLLAQGRFAEFLNARPADRDKVLKGLFGHGRVDVMREVAREHARVAEVEVEKLTVRLEHVADVKAELVDLQTQHEGVTRRVERLDEAAEGVAELDREIAELARALEAAATKGRDLEEMAERLPDEDAAEAVLKAAGKAEDERAQRAGSLQIAEAALQESSKRLQATKAAGGRNLIEKAAGLLPEAVAARRRLESNRDRVVSLESRLEGANGAIQAMESTAQAAADILVEGDATVVAAEAAVEAARAARHAAGHRNMASELRLTLAVGEPCPVCAQDVAAAPPALETGELTEADRALTAARAKRERLVGERAAAAEESARAIAGIEAAEIGRDQVVSDLDVEREKSQALEVELEGLEVAVRELLGEGDPETTLTTIRHEYDAATERVAEATKLVEVARSDHDTAIQSQLQVEVSLDELRMRLVDIAARTDIEIRLDDLDNAVGSLRESLRSQVQATIESEKSAGARHSVAVEKRAELLTALDVDNDFAGARAASKERRTMLGQAISVAEKKIEVAADIDEALVSFLNRRDTFTRLAKDLTDARFTRFLLDEERTHLAEIGSEHFSRLSSGRYRFTDDGVFEIVDLTAADAVRKSDSLSGGETFLASLALALALAELVAREGGRLDAFFLDEGFGSLDSEHLDLAMEGIEALVAESQDRLVVVVSHVPDLRHRVDDLIVLDRDPTTGDSRLVSA